MSLATTQADLDASDAAAGLTRTEHRRLTVIAVALFAIYSTYALARHDRYLTTGFDLGIFDQAVRAYAHLEAPMVPLKAPGYHLLGDHFHPIIALWAPLYWIWADPRMLLMAQAALIAVSVWPVAAFTARRLGPRAALVVAGLYGLSWPLQRMVQFDVHEIAFAVPLIALAVDAVDRRARRTVLLACVGLLATREDMGVLVLLFGVLVATLAVRPFGPHRRLRPRRDDLIAGASLMLLGAVGYQFATGVVIPHFSGGAGFVYWTFPDLGPDPRSAVAFMLTHPWSVRRPVRHPVAEGPDPARARNAHALPVPGVEIRASHPSVARPAHVERAGAVVVDQLPLLRRARPDPVPGGCRCAGRAEPRRPGRRTPRALDRPGRGGRWTARVRGGRWTARVRGGGDALVRVWLAGSAAVLVFGMLSLAGDYPVSRVATAQFWQRDLRVQAIDRVLPQIPEGVCVEADNSVAPQLTGRDYVTRVGRSEGLATWMVLDFSRADTGWEGGTPRAAYANAQARGFVPVVQDDVIVLLRRPGAVDPICRAR